MELLANAPPESPVILRREADIERGYAAINALGQINPGVLPDEVEFAIVQSMRNCINNSDIYPYT